MLLFLHREKQSKLLWSHNPPAITFLLWFPFQQNWLKEVVSNAVCCLRFFSHSLLHLLPAGFHTHDSTETGLLWSPIASILPNTILSCYLAWPWGRAEYTVHQISFLLLGTYFLICTWRWPKDGILADGTWVEGIHMPSKPDSQKHPLLDICSSKSPLHLSPPCSGPQEPSLGILLMSLLVSGWVESLGCTCRRLKEGGRKSGNLFPWIPNHFFLPSLQV